MGVEGPNTPLGTGKTYVLVGLYGLPGCGKTRLLNQLKDRLDQKEFLLFEGSEVVTEATEDGLDVFKSFSPSMQHQVRETAIKKIQSTCREGEKAGVVAGHFSFWEDQAEEKPEEVITEADLRAYTHIIYLKTSAAHIAKRRQNEKARRRAPIMAALLDKW
jgi:adenylate kinase